jgi:putative FmdB family regulatory protein
MPLYEYECQKCQKISEFLLKISGPHPDECPVCKHTQMKKLLSRTNFVLKGTGWYETDFKKKDNATSAATAAKTAADKAESAAGAGSSEPQPAAANEKSSSSEGSEKTAAPTAAATPTPSSSSAPAAEK